MSLHVLSNVFITLFNFTFKIHIFFTNVAVVDDKVFDIFLNFFLKIRYDIS